MLRNLGIELPIRKTPNAKQTETKSEAKKEKGDGKDEKVEVKIAPNASSRSPLSIMIDGSTDSARLDQQIMFIRGVVNGLSSTHFVGVKSVKDGGSESTERVIWELVEELHLDKHRLFGLGSDGAKQMTGKHAGVGARIVRVLAFLLQNHCITHRYYAVLALTSSRELNDSCLHRLALAAGQSAELVPYLHSHFKDDLQSIYQFFDKSGPRSAHLKDLQILLEDEELKMAKVGDTRWLR